MDVFMWNGLFSFFFSFATFVYPSHHELREYQHSKEYLYQTSIIMPSQGLDVRIL
jgi:hypothetical protein